jgi:XTP/dITP diphosphohydrolase
MTEIVLATGNKGKLREFKEIFKDLPIVWRSLSEFEGIEEIKETGTTFLENAELKAVGYARATGKYCLADDSGLEVAALGNAPGVYSARYGGENTTFAEKNSKLLAELAATKDIKRAAQFVCIIVLANEKGEIIGRAEGICPGNIASEPTGMNGFGYDPIFIPTGFEQTFGELSGDIKHRISHRARATEEIKRYLGNFFNS